MSDKKFQAKITSDTRKADNWVSGKISDAVTFRAKVFDEPSEYGINKGKVSKLEIYENDKWIVNYDRGWDVKPKTPEHKEMYKAVMTRLKDLGKVFGLDAENKPQRTLHEKLAAAKEKANLREFDVTITETLQMTVTVKAKSREEAERIVSEKWHDDEYLIDAEHFKGVAFEAAGNKREHSRQEER
jgi:ABC-type enterochelin transport system substrate-binding protein